MISLKFEGRDDSKPLRILCLGAHCDDIELGCGGTMLSLSERYPSARVYWVVFASNSVRASEAKGSANSILCGFKDSRVVIKEFRESYFPYIALNIKEYFETLKLDFDPDVIFTHYRDDRHQDHRLISDLTWNTFRNHLILEYEILKYDGDIGSPNMYVPLSVDQSESKIALLFEYFRSQQSKSWFDKDAFVSMMRIRGVECNATTGFAEGFYCRKLVFGGFNYQWIANVAAHPR